MSNFDGSQDEGDRQNDDVLREFFAPYAGSDASKWPQHDVRLIAINEGRLVDFLSAEKSRFPLLTEIVLRGLGTGVPQHRVAVVNLNLRSVVADVPTAEGSLLERLIRRMTNEKFWKPCQNCDLNDRCYAHHNARTIQDETAGPKVIERLKSLYTLAHLRGRLHITLRDLQPPWPTCSLVRGTVGRFTRFIRRVNAKRSSKASTSIAGWAEKNQTQTDC